MRTDLSRFESGNPVLNEFRNRKPAKFWCKPAELRKSFSGAPDIFPELGQPLKSPYHLTNTRMLGQTRNVNVKESPLVSFQQRTSRQNVDEDVRDDHGIDLIFHGLRKEKDADNTCIKEFRLQGIRYYHTSNAIPPKAKSNHGSPSNAARTLDAGTPRQL